MTRIWVAVAATLLTAACTGSSQRAAPAPTAPTAPVVTRSPSGSPSVTATPADGATSQPTRARAITGVSDFRVADVSFVSRDHGFALGTAACHGRHCTVLLESVDGARHWTVRSVVPAGPGDVAEGSCPGGSCLSHLRFVTAKVGYVFNPGLLMTTDGGLTWQVQKGRAVSSLEGDSRSVLRVSTKEAGCAGDVSWLESSPPGSTRWTKVRQLAADHICAPTLYRPGRDQLVLVSYGNRAGCCPAATIYTSTDRGRSLTRRADPCQQRPDGPGATVYAALAPHGVIAHVCETVNPTSNSLRVSTDGGASYEARRGFSSDMGRPICGLAAASGTRLLLITNCGPHVTNFSVTEDGGRSWEGSDEFGPGGGVRLIGFQDPLTARAAQDDEIDTTTDGGKSWRSDQFVPE